MNKARFLSILSLIVIATMLVTACQPKAAEQTEAPAAAEVPEAVIPAFDFACTPADEATVKPVDIMPSKPLKIAVLGLENNPFWIPVKEGTVKAAEELALQCDVDWIVPGEAHTADFFSAGIEAAIAQEYDAIATIAGEAGHCAVHRDGSRCRHSCGNLQLRDSYREWTRCSSWARTCTNRVKPLAKQWQKAWR